MTRLHRGGIGASLTVHFRDRHLAGIGEQLRQMALVTRIQVLNEHEGHTGIARQMAEQFRECLQPPAEAPTPTMR